MAQLGNYVSEQLAEPSDDFTPIPPGTYSMEVIESDIIEARSGRGTLLKLTLRVTEGEFEGRRVWSQLNIRHENQTAQEIGQRQLSDLSRACGFTTNPSDSEAFHGIPIKVSVKIGKTTPEYPDAKNEVSRFIAADQIAPAVTPRQQAAPQPARRQQFNVSGRPVPAFLKNRAG